MEYTMSTLANLDLPFAKAVRDCFCKSSWYGFSANVQGKTCNLTVYVAENAPKVELPFQIPAIDLKLETVRTAPIFRTRNSPAHTSSRLDFMPGSAVSARATDEQLPIGSNSGSVGAYAQSKDGSVWLLTANHVISQNGEFRNMERIPGSDDGVYVNQFDRVSFEVKFVKIAQTDNVADVAGAKLENPSVIPRRNLYDGLVLDGRPYTPPQNAPIKVFSRGGNKGGTVASIGENGVRVAQSFEPRFPIYDNQILIQGDPGDSVVDGDSGSLVAAFDNQEETWRPIGFVFAKTNNTGLAVVTPLQATFDSLERWTGKMTKILVSGEL